MFTITFFFILRVNTLSDSQNTVLIVLTALHYKPKRLIKWRGQRFQLWYILHVPQCLYMILPLNITLFCFPTLGFCSLTLHTKYFPVRFVRILLSSAITELLHYIMLPHQSQMLLCNRQCCHAPTLPLFLQTSNGNKTSRCQAYRVGLSVQTQNNVVTFRSWLVESQLQITFFSGKRQKEIVYLRRKKRQQCFLRRDALLNSTKVMRPTVHCYNYNFLYVILVKLMWRRGDGRGAGRCSARPKSST